MLITYVEGALVSCNNKIFKISHGNVNLTVISQMMIV